jgi:hypothetical protein
LWYKSKAFILRWRTGDSVVAGQRKTKRRKCLATPGPEKSKKNRGAKSCQNGTIKQISRTEFIGAYRRFPLVAALLRWVST